MTNPLVVDLSHWDPAYDYAAVREDGIAGVIYKATEGGNYTDPTYVEQQQMAKSYGLLWGGYHFADASDVLKQVDNFLRYCAPDPDELFCLDWEDNGGDKMSMNDVIVWIGEVEAALKREGQCVIYGGNTIKEALGDDVHPFFAERRLWLCHYADTPVVPASWDDYWLWQYTDGIYGPTPHEIDGIGPCDINSFVGNAEKLADEWAGGRHAVPPWGRPTRNAVSMLVYASPDVTVKVRQVRGTEDNVRKNRKLEAE